MVKGKERCDGWTTAIDDLGLWQDGEEEQHQRSPFLQRAAHSDRKSNSNEQCRRDQQVPTFNCKSITSRRNGKVEEVDSADHSNKGIDDISRDIIERSCAIASSSKAPSTSTAPKESNPSRTPWQYAKKSTSIPQVSVAYGLPVSNNRQEESVRLEETGNVAGELPPFAFRKPQKICNPSQQTIRIPFSAVENGDNDKSGQQHFGGKELLEIRPAATKSSYRNSATFSEECSSSRKATPSKVHDETSSSSRTFLASPPPSSYYHRQPSKLPSSTPKRAWQPRKRNSQRGLKAAKVVYQRGLTNQSKLSFAPLSSPRATPKANQYHSNSSPKSSQHVQTSQHYSPAHHSSAYNSPLPQPQRQWETQICSSAYRPQLGDYSQTNNTLYQHRYDEEAENTAYTSLRGRSEMEQAIDREFYKSIQDSPVQGRLAADYRALNGGCDRRIQQYPRVFDQDPVQKLKQSKERLAEFRWSTTSNKGRLGAAITQKNLPFTPRLGAACKSKARHRVVNQEIGNDERSLSPLSQPQQQNGQSGLNDAFRHENRQGNHQKRAPLSVVSISSDEFDSEFDDHRKYKSDELARLDSL